MIDFGDWYLEDCEHGKSDVVEGCDASIWSSPFLQANTNIRVAEVRTPSEQNSYDVGGGW